MVVLVLSRTIRIDCSAFCVLCVHSTLNALLDTCFECVLHNVQACQPYSRNCYDHPSAEACRSVFIKSAPNTVAIQCNASKASHQCEWCMCVHKIFIYSPDILSSYMCANRRCIINSRYILYLEYLAFVLLKVSGAII